MNPVPVKEIIQNEWINVFIRRTNDLCFVVVVGLSAGSIWRQRHLVCLGLYNLWWNERGVTNLCSCYLFLFPRHDAQAEGGSRVSEDQFNGSRR